MRQRTRSAWSMVAMPMVAMVAALLSMSGCDRAGNAPAPPQRIVGCVTPSPGRVAHWYVQFGEGTCRGATQVGVGRERPSAERAVRRVTALLNCAQDVRCSDFAIDPEARPQLTAAHFHALARTPRLDTLLFFFAGRKPMEFLQVTVQGDTVTMKFIGI